MFGVGTGEVMLILAIAMLVVGPERMVTFARQAGEWIAKFRQQTDSVTAEFREALTLDAEAEEGADAPSAQPSATPAVAAPDGAGATQSAPQSGPASQPAAETAKIAATRASLFSDGEVQGATATILPPEMLREGEIDGRMVSIDIVGNEADESAEDGIQLGGPELIDEPPESQPTASSDGDVTS